MKVLKRAFAFGLLAVIASPALGQSYCDAKNQYIGCEYHPDYGWIGYGSAPRKQPGPEYQAPKLTPEQQAARKKAEREREEQDRERRENDALFRRITAALPYWVELPPGGTCLADSHARRGVDPRHAYTETRKSCATGDLVACDALLNACTPDAIDESKRGTCFSAANSASYYAKYTGADLWALQDECEVVRNGAACSIASNIHRSGLIPEALPQQAYHYAYFACKYGSDMDCDHLFSSCIAPVPKRSGMPPRRARHYMEGSCSFPKVTRKMRKEVNTQPPDVLSQWLSSNQRGCMRGDPAMCAEAAIAHAVYTAVPEAKAQDAYYFMWLACQKDNNYCEDLESQCKAGGSAPIR